MWLFTYVGAVFNGITILILGEHAHTHAHIIVPLRESSSKGILAFFLAKKIFELRSEIKPFPGDHESKM